MYNELKKCINKYEDSEDKALLLEQIQFFQHERLIHLLVTLFVGLLAIVFFILFMLLKIILIGLIFLVLFVLFIPYIIHYYRLENGVQKLYKIYLKR